MDTWIVLIEDRHADGVEALPFSSKERAILAARKVVPDDTPDGELNPAMRADDWVLYLPYRLHGVFVRVIKRTLDDDRGW